MHWQLLRSMRMSRHPTDPFAPLRAQACSSGEASSKGLPQPAGDFNGAACEPRLARLMVPLPDGYPCLAHARAVGSPHRAVHLFPPVCPHCVRTLCPAWAVLTAPVRIIYETL
jgi:hypothetical protein